MGKAIFFDIDGTLVNFRGRMPGSTRHAIKQIQEKGHRIVICTGRSLCQIYPWLIDMHFDGIIAAAGAYVECDSRIIYEHHMDREAIAAVLSSFRRVNASYAAQTKDMVIVTPDNKKRLLDRFSSMGVSEDMAVQFWKSVYVGEYPIHRQDIEKFTFFDARTTVSNIQEELSDYCDVTGLSFENPTDNSGEISCKGINKSLGIRKYIEHTGIAREDTIAFGDGPNDMDMIEYARVGVAMGNAIDELKQRADYMTAGVDEDGIEHALKMLGLL